MHLTKTERIYKKKLFRYLKIKKKSKQKELTSRLIKTDAYKQGGFKKVYFCTKNCRSILSNIVRAFSRIAATAIATAKSMSELSRSLKENKRILNKIYGKKSPIIVVDEIPYEKVNKGE